MLDYRNADLSERDRALCDYAVRLTLNPGAMGPSNIQTLRSVAWSDEEISLATQVISYFNYINRIADGLGVDPEPWMIEGKEQWLSNRADDWSRVERQRVHDP